MARGILGNYNGTATPGVNMVEVFKENELAANPGSSLRYAPMVIKKIGITADPDTQVTINGSKIQIPASGAFELAYGMINIVTLVFDSAVDIKIFYIY